jgi:AraC family transcriptional regulator, regulatory protein of adaptative response / methylated-DNA-[protein]-cysteine methyltransferase
MPNDPHVDLVRRVCELIDAHADEPLTLDDLGTAFDVSPTHLQRVFKRIMGISPRQYARARRLGDFKARLKEQTSVTTALHQAGYGSASRVYENADDHLGMTPGEYRRGAPHTAITYALPDSPLGRLLLAGTQRGVCAVYLGDEDGPLETELAREFSAATRTRDDAGLAEWSEQVKRHLSGSLPHLDLPLDVRATAFQWRVWQKLLEIPRGSTRTYSEIARELGETDPRAVGHACATNPVSVIIPCHRVVRKDGGLAGYRWGVQRKKKLLEQERKGEE